MRKTEKRRTDGQEEGEEIEWQTGKVQIEIRREGDRKVVRS